MQTETHSCNYIAWHASQTIIVTESIFVLQEYVIHDVAHPVLQRSTDIRAQRTFTVCRSTLVLNKQLDFMFLGRKPGLQCFCKFVLSACTVDQFPSYQRCIVSCTKLHTRDTALYASFLPGPDPLRPSFETSRI